MELHEIRLQNMRLLARQEGSMTALARKVGMSRPQANNYGGKHPKNKMGLKVAARIERALGLEPGWMDQIHEVQPKEGAWPFASVTYERFMAAPAPLRALVESYMQRLLDAHASTELPADGMVG